MKNKFVYISYFAVIFFVFNLLLSPVHANMGSKEIPYFKFNSRMTDPFTGLPDLLIKFTYARESDLINIYYQSGICLTALLFDKPAREQLLEYIKKYEEWNRIAVEKKDTLIKKMGEIKIKIFFQYAGVWHNGDQIVARIYFFSIDSKRHQFLIRPIKTISNENQYLIFKPEILYFNYEDAQILKKAVSENFVQEESQKVREQQNSIVNEYQ